MSSRQLLAWCVCVLSCATTAVAQRPTLKPAPAGKTAPPVAKVENVYTSRETLAKGVTLARMTNGMAVIVQENHSAPVATVRCYVSNTGSAYEGRDLGAGLSHMLEHILAGGSTTRRTKAQFSELFDSLGGKTNAYTSESVTAFHIDCPGSAVNLAIELIADNMQNSTIPENEYVQELGVVQRELEMYAAEREAVLYDTLKLLIYAEHPARHPIVGYQDVVQQVRREDVIAYYKHRYVPQNMTVVVVGDIETDSVLETVLAMFKSFRRTTERTVSLPTEPDQVSPRSMRLEMEGPSTQAVFAWPTVPLQNSDLYALDVASFILTHGDTSRLVHRLQIEEPLADAIDSASNTPGYVRGWFQVTVQSEPAKFAEVQKITFEEIERLQSEPVQEQELAKAKRQKAVEHVMRQQTVENQAESLSESFRSTGDPLFDSRYVEEIQKVTAEQVQEVAKKYFVAAKLNTVIIEPLGSRATQTGGTTPAPKAETETPILKKQLANGLTVLLKKQANLPLVTIQAFVKAGAVADTAEKSGLAALTTSMLEKGTTKYSADEIAEHFDSVGGTLALDSRSNTSYLQAAVLKPDALTTLDLMQQMLQAPTFPEEEVGKVQQLQLAQIADRKSEAQTEILDFWTGLLPASTPYSRKALGEQATVAKLTVTDCQQFHSRYFVPNNMVLSVFGDIDPEAVLRQIEDSFGKAPKATKFQWPEFPTAPALLLADAKHHLVHQKPNTAMVLLAFPMVSVRDPKTRAAIDVLEAVLTGGGGAGGRFHEELRGDQLVYYVFGMPMTGLAPGYFVFLAQTRPESLEQVVAHIQNGLVKIRNEGIPADEFARAKSKLVVAHAMSKTTPAERAFQASIDELYGLGYNFDETYPERIGAVKLEDVLAVVTKYFRHGIVATSAPEPAKP
ncbi:MAG: insulinase family protein [Planctomycetes bacterium]|nr:insulinase family protein [Planctomycetota bacterium]